jgi:hypothetical protein
MNDDKTDTRNDAPSRSHLYKAAKSGLMTKVRHCPKCGGTKTLGFEYWDFSAPPPLPEHVIDGHGRRLHNHGSACADCGCRWGTVFHHFNFHTHIFKTEELTKCEYCRRTHVDWNARLPKNSTCRECASVPISQRKGKRIASLYQPKAIRGKSHGEPEDAKKRTASGSPVRSAKVQPPKLKPRTNRGKKGKQP